MKAFIEEPPSSGQDPAVDAHLALDVFEVEQFRAAWTLRLRGFFTYRQMIDLAQSVSEADHPALAFRSAAVAHAQGEDGMAS